MQVCLSIYDLLLPTGNNRLKTNRKVKKREDQIYSSRFSVGDNSFSTFAIFFGKLTFVTTVTPDTNTYVFVSRGKQS